MLSNWQAWIASQPPADLLWMLLPMLLFDATRYCLSIVLMCLYDAGRALFTGVDVTHTAADASWEDPRTCPRVCAIVAGLNESRTIGATLESLWGSYPRLEIVVVDDGSTDEMAAVARQFAATHSGVLVLSRPRRGGKSSALNFALAYTDAEIVVCVDADSHLQPGAIARIIAPLADPEVGAVSGTVIARNGLTNLVTLMQAGEYLRSIFVGRWLASRANMLSIIAGAFGAFRREALLRVGAWDVGPGEDGDLALRLRKSGWRIVHAPYAQCLTNLPTSWRRLVLQRRRWDWAIVTFECRKHVDLGNVLSGNFRASNLAVLIETWLFRIACSFATVGYVVWLASQPWPRAGYLLATTYLAYLALEIVQWLVVLYYSHDWRRDAVAIAVFPLAPMYYSLLKLVTLWAILEELLWRHSYEDNFVPQHVRTTTWKW
jgi:cellulose synthase/poly-beta-1,6-N-acetylglucosamine synthase-like glycosyltransferase